MKNRDDRMKHATEWYEDIKIRMAKETEDSIKRTKVYGPTWQRQKSVDRKNKYEVRLLAIDSVSALFEEAEGKTAVLNYASYKNPGGFFLGGSAAQEEALCHESNLYPVLLAFDDSYYAWNKKNLNKALYLDRGLYNPDIIFKHLGKRITADVITCPAPNYRTALKYQNVSMKENLEAFKSRIDFMFNMAEDNNVDTLIIGAWGCGVFMQPPEEVCRLLVTSLLTHNWELKKIIFAIPNPASDNYRAFKRVLKNFRGNAR